MGNCRAIYLLQARHGKEKETNKSAGVETPITFADYSEMLTNFKLVKESDAFEAHRKMSQSGGYFQAVWERE